MTINVNSNPANTEFAIQDVGSGNYINKATGARILGATPSWGTYAEFGSGSGITVTGLTEGNLYVFKVKARNGDNVATAFSSTSSARTKSIVLAASLPASVSTVVLATDGVTDLTSTDNAQTGTQTVQLQSTGSVPVVDFAFDFDSGNLDLTGVVVDSDAALKEAVVTGVTPTHTLYIPKGETDNQVTICPSATTLEEVYEGCAGAILAYDGYSADGITVSISGSYWKVDGLTGTGGFSSSSVESVNVQARQKISTLSTHNFGFNMSSGTNFAAGDTMIITFQDDGGGAWTFPADGDWVTGDFTFNDGTARTILAVGASPSCSSGANNVTVTTSQSGKSLTVTACTGYTASGTGAPVALNVVTARITNPEVAGSYEIWLTGSYGDLQSEFEVPILTDDQVSLTASVDTYINFNVTTSYGTDNALSLGEISFGSIASSNDSNRPDGSGGTLPVDNISLSLDTNATGGTLVQVMSASGGLASTVANYTLTSASETLAINQNSVSDTAGYGLQAQSVTPTRGTLTKQSPFAGSSNTVGAVSGTFATIYSSPADIGVVGASANVYVLAVPAKNTPAADDYIDTLTFRATGTF